MVAHWQHIGILPACLHWPSCLLGTFQVLWTCHNFGGGLGGSSLKRIWTQACPCASTLRQRAQTAPPPPAPLESPSTKKTWQANNFAFTNATAFSSPGSCLSNFSWPLAETVPEAWRRRSAGSDRSRGPSCLVERELPTSYMVVSQSTTKLRRQLRGLRCVSHTCMAPRS